MREEGVGRRRRRRRRGRGLEASGMVRVLVEPEEPDAIMVEGPEPIQQAIQLGRSSSWLPRRRPSPAQTPHH